MPSIFRWQPDADVIITVYRTLMLRLALAFQIPVVMFILAKIGDLDLPGVVIATAWA